MNPTALPQSRLDAIEADVAADRFADLTIHRSWGGQIRAEWTGGETLPLKVAKPIEAEIPTYPIALVRVRDLDEGTALYARP